MKTIWKFALSVTDYQWQDWPKGAKILSVQMQDGKVCVWAVVDPTAEYEPRSFGVVGTGNLCWCDDWEFIGTVQERVFVWHVFTRLGTGIY